MSEYGVSEEPAAHEPHGGRAFHPAPAPGDGEPWFERAEAAPTDDSMEEPVEEYADPQEWISGLIADLERAEQGIGSGPRDALMARIKLAQAYSELGDTVQAAPLAVANVAQAERLFPSSEGMLRQLREFRNAACEAAGWTAAMLRDLDEADAADDDQEPSELVARPEVAVKATEAAAEAAAVVEEAAAVVDPAVAVEPTVVVEQDAGEAAARPQAAPAEDWTAEHEPVPAAAEARQLAESESAGAVIHEFVRRTPEPDALQWAAEVQAALTQPAELAIPSPPEPEYAEEVEPALAADLADLSDLADLAAIEEIIRLRYELREAQRTIERLRHVNRKLREALEFDEAQ
jgi:hypothetical protein